MRRQLNIIIGLLIIITEFAIAESRLPSSIETYQFNGNTFEIYFRQNKIYNHEVGYEVYFISNNVRTKVFDDDHGFDDGEEIFWGQLVTFPADYGSISPDRKYIMIERVLYGSLNDDDGSFIKHHDEYTCNFISTETGDIVSHSDGSDCDFTWDPIYSGVRRTFYDDEEFRKRYRLNELDGPAKIKYDDLTKVFKEVESLFKARNYRKIKDIANKSIIKLDNISSKNVVTLNNLGYYYSEAGAYVEAVQILSAVCHYDHNRTVAILNLADTFNYMKNMRQSKFYYQQYIREMESQNKLDKIPARVLDVFGTDNVDDILDMENLYLL